MEGERLIEKVLKLARENGINQSELSRQIQVHPSRFSEWKSGVSRPNLTQVLGMARILQVSVDYLVKDELKDPHNVSGLSRDEEAIISLVRALNLNLNEALRRLATAQGSPQQLAPTTGSQVEQPTSAIKDEGISDSPRDSKFSPGCFFEFKDFYLLGIDEIPDGSVICKKKQVIHHLEAEPGSEYPIHGDFQLYTPPNGIMQTFVTRLVPRELTFKPSFGSVIHANGDISITEPDGTNCTLQGPMSYAVIFKESFTRGRTEAETRRRIDGTKRRDEQSRDRKGF